MLLRRLPRLWVCNGSEPSWLGGWEGSIRHESNKDFWISLIDCIIVGISIHTEQVSNGHY